MDTETDTQSETNEGGTTPPDDASTTAPELLGDRAKLEMIQIDRLDAHPQNPRIGGLREDVVSAIEVSVRADGFKRYFAGIGRTKSDGRTEILKGHHQTEGARRAGLKAIPMWIVNEITDEEALRLLAFSNAQGELTPLEIALASFAVVPAKGRKGLGLAEFASRMGVKPPNLTRYRRGVEVYRALVDSGTSDDIIKGCRDRAEHLAVIKGADPGRWPELVDQCVHGRWSIDETKAQVRRDDQKEEDGESEDGESEDGESGDDDEKDEKPKDKGEADDNESEGNGEDDESEGNDEDDDESEDDDNDDEGEDGDESEDDEHDDDESEDDGEGSVPPEKEENTNDDGEVAALPAVASAILTALGATTDAQALTLITELRQQERAAQAEAGRLRKTVAKLEKELDTYLTGGAIGAVIRELGVNTIKQALAAIKELKSNAAA